MGGLPSWIRVKHGINKLGRYHWLDQLLAVENSSLITLSIQKGSTLALFIRIPGLN